MSRFPHRRGFTLVELLVVIAIIGTLVALLLPAVQGARESARKMSCSNNLHNLSLAATQYHDSLNSFPTGWIYTEEGNVPVEGWSWGALMLPYLEQRPLHTSLGITSYRLDTQLASIPSNPNMLNLIATPLKIFMCPTDSGFSGRGQTDSSRPFDVGFGTSNSGASPLNVGVSNYVGVMGHRFVSGPTRNTGVFFGNSYVRMADIVDGTSNTAIIGERDTLSCHSGTWIGILNPAGFPVSTAGSAPLSGFSMVAGYSFPKLNQGTLSQQGTLTINYNLCGAGFSSLHPGGAQFAFADGSVRFINTSISWDYVPKTGPLSPPGDLQNHKDPANGVYQRIMTISDRIPTSLD